MGVGKERRTSIGPWGYLNIICKTCYSNYLEDYYFWPCASGLSALNVINTQLRDLINSGLTGWCWWLMDGRRREKGEESRE